MIEMIDTGVAFVAAFEDAVVRSGLRLVTFRNRAFVFDDSKHSRGTGVGYVLNLRSSEAGSLEHIDGADDVHHCSQTRIGLTGWYLQAREMNDVGNAIVIDD